MSQLAPEGSVYQAGTLSGNPLAVAAGVATIALLEGASYEQLEALGELAEEGLQRALRDSGLGGCVQRAGSMLTLFFGPDRVDDFASASRSAPKLFSRYFHGMMERGIYLPPSQYEAAFISMAHTADQIEQLTSAAREVLSAIARDA